MQDLWRYKRKLKGLAGPLGVGFGVPVARARWRRRHHSGIMSSSPLSTSSTLAPGPAMGLWGWGAPGVETELEFPICAHPVQESSTGSWRRSRFLFLPLRWSVCWLFFFACCCCGLDRLGKRWRAEVPDRRIRRLMRRMCCSLPKFGVRFWNWWQRFVGSMCSAASGRAPAPWSDEEEEQLP